MAIPITVSCLCLPWYTGTQKVMTSLFGPLLALQVTLSENPATGFDLGLPRLFQTLGSESETEDFPVSAHFVCLSTFLINNTQNAFQKVGIK